MSDDPILQLFTTCATRLVNVPHRGVGIGLPSMKDRWPNCRASKIDCVRDVSVSGGGGADIVDCGQFSAGELGLDCEQFERMAVDLPVLLERKIVSNDCGVPHASQFGRSSAKFQEGWCSVIRQ